MVRENDTWRWCGSEETFRNQVIQVIRSTTLNTIRCTGTSEDTDANGNIYQYEIEVEQARPKKLHQTVKTDDGEILEEIFIGDDYCYKKNNADWVCGGGSASELPSTLEMWISVVEGQPTRKPMTVIEQSASLDTKKGKECRLYSSTETDGMIKNELAICVDIDTKYPIINETVIKENNHIKASITCFDFNEPMDISLPTP